MSCRILVTPVGPSTLRVARSRSPSVSVTSTGAASRNWSCKGWLKLCNDLHAAVRVTPCKTEFDENMFLDPATKPMAEETGGANFLFDVTKNSELVTPKSDSILPSITQTIPRAVLTRDCLPTGNRSTTGQTCLSLAISQSADCAEPQQ